MPRAPGMAERGYGRIVNISSILGNVSRSQRVAYTTSKAGLLGLVHTAANELGPYQIRVNAVCPGLIRTRLTERHFSDPEVLRDYFRQIPLGRGGEPIEVANVILFMASEESSFMTANTVMVDGGYTEW